MSYIDPFGLRRRSPNPNSPIPYSPALLSPYIPTTAGWSDTPNERQRHLSADHTPTIRLVGPSEAGSSYYAPPPTRTQSDDRHVRASTIPDSVSSLRRHGTDLKFYPSSRPYRPHRDHRESRESLSGEHMDKPVPPLPLNIRRHESHSQSSTPSLRSDRTGSMPSPSAFSGRSVVTTLKSFRNPFRKDDRDESPTIPGYTHTRAPSSKSLESVSMISSRSSTATLPVPFYPNPYLASMSSDSINDPKTIERAKSLEIGGKLTSKFPMRREGKKEGWTGFKWILLLSIVVLLGYGFAGLTWALRILLRINDNSDVTMVSDPDIVIFLTLASLLCIFSALVGLTGVLLNSRPILAFYNLLLWPTLLSMCLIGYPAYKRGNMNLDRKLNQTWSQFLDDEQRLRIQNSLRCCGYFNPMHDATYSKKCYPRTGLPGCKSKYTKFERHELHLFATAAFSAIPCHLIVIAIAVLCSNHVNKTFGKGLTPPAYRLRMADVRANAVAVLAALPTPSRPTSSLARQPAISRRPRPTSGHSTTASLSSVAMSSTDTLTETIDMKRRRSRSGWVGEVMREAGPRGRALREARDRGLL